MIPANARQIADIEAEGTALVRVEVLTYRGGRDGPESRSCVSIRRFVAGKGRDEAGLFFPSAAGLTIQPYQLRALIDALVQAEGELEAAS